MKKSIILLVALATCSLTAFAQINKDQLALEVSKVDAENTEKLKAYIWKFHAVVSGEGGNKTTLISEFRFDEKGELNINVVDGETNIDRKAGVRGKMQQNVIESKLAYVSDAMKYSLAYTYMTKGQLLDFFDKAEVTEKDGVLIAKGEDVYVKGDQLTIRIDAKSKYFLSKTFSTKLGEDSINGEVQYETFASLGVNHISTTKLEMLVEKITIDGENKDYTIRVD
ncbi:MAG: hypothetical protein HC892_15010 [Saprospiraceae bacterium]|nr:hypothetical protein [Saprospiraceae bacterium]